MNGFENKTKNSQGQHMSNNPSQENNPLLPHSLLTESHGYCVKHIFLVYFNDVFFLIMLKKVVKCRICIFFILFYHNFDKYLIASLKSSDRIFSTMCMTSETDGRIGKTALLYSYIKETVLITTNSVCVISES